MNFFNGSRHAGNRNIRIIDKGGKKKKKTKLPTLISDRKTSKRINRKKKILFAPRQALDSSFF